MGGVDGGLGAWGSEGESGGLLGYIESSTLVALRWVHWRWRRALAKKAHILHRAALSLFYRVQVKKVFFVFSETVFIFLCIHL